MYLFINNLKTKLTLQIFSIHFENVEPKIRRGLEATTSRNYKFYK